MRSNVLPRCFNIELRGSHIAVTVAEAILGNNKPRRTFAYSPAPQLSPLAHCVYPTLKARCVAHSKPSAAFDEQKAVLCNSMVYRPTCFDQCYSIHCPYHGEQACGNSKSFQDCATCCDNNSNEASGCFRRRRRLGGAGSKPMALLGEDDATYTENECAASCLDMDGCIGFQVKKGMCLLTDKCGKGSDDGSFERGTWNIHIDESFEAPKRRRRRRKKPVPEPPTPAGPSSPEPPAPTPSPTDDNGMPICCMDISAECRACGMGLSVEDFCHECTDLGLDDAGCSDCATVCPPPTTEPGQCPVGMRIVGNPGADIGGCGLQSCGDRYDLTTIDECAARCHDTPACNAFNWADFGQDRNHVGQQVCTLYAQDRPTSSWGSQQLFCAYEQMVGGTRDRFGCVGSAGYTYCHASQRCQRSWEEDCADVPAPSPTMPDPAPTCDACNVEAIYAFLTAGAPAPWSTDEDGTFHLVGGDADACMNGLA